MAKTAIVTRLTPLPPTSQPGQFERLLTNAAKIAVVLIGAVVVLAVLRIGQVIIAPVLLAVVIGLMFGPLADRLERLGVPPALSALVVVLALVSVLVGAIILFAMPLSEWVGRAPAIWEKFRAEIANWKGPLEAISSAQQQLSSVFGSSASMAVKVEDGGPLANAAFLAPAIAAQVLVFLASLYFFVATRDHIRMSVLSLCVSRRLRWRLAHTFQEVEQRVSRFLISITLINICVGLAVTLAMWALGLPSPLLWGALAAVLNYIPYVGQATMALILLGVGLGTQTGTAHILLPVGCYVLINFIEGQIVTPQFIGRTMTLNPFLIFLSITFWLWAWGPVGGLVAVPSLLIVTSILDHALPSKPSRPSKPLPLPRTISAKDAVLANAAAMIREQAQEQATSVDSNGKKSKLIPPEGTAPTGADAAG